VIIFYLPRNVQDKKTSLKVWKRISAEERKFKVEKHVTTALGVKLHYDRSTKQEEQE
jgi:hypothetical protein